MNNVIKASLSAGILILLLVNISVAQSNSTVDSAYLKVVQQRADKIVAKLDIKNAGEATQVRDIIAMQYVNLNVIHDAANANLKQIKELHKNNKEQLDRQIRAVEDEVNSKLNVLHQKYLSELSAHLNAQQVEQVKDGMTYGVLPITYKGYQEMLPNLTVKQKKQILDYLTEAREHAMDAGSSEKKHAWFGKYKGRINNYLSKEGIDMKKASKDWEERIKAAKANNKS